MENQALPGAFHHPAGSQAIRLEPYWIGPLTELEAPTLLLIVAEKEAMVWSNVSPLGTVPAKVNGTETVNSPPKAWEAVLSNQTVASGPKGTDSCPPESVNPVAAVNCTFNAVRLRVLE